MDANTVGDLRRFNEFRGGAMHKIARIHGQGRIVTREIDTAAGFVEGKRVAQIDGMKEGFQFVKTIGPLAEDVQQQVDLAGGLSFEGHRHKKKRQHQDVGARQSLRRLSCRKYESGFRARTEPCRHH